MEPATAIVGQTVCDLASVMRSCQVADDIREDASMVEVRQLHLSVKANDASERFPIVGSNSHILAGTDLTEVGREIDAVPLMSSEAK